MQYCPTQLLYKQVRNAFLFSGALLLFASCEQRIDASSQEATTESIKKICEDLSPSEKEIFQASCLIIAIDAGIADDGYKKLDGLTVEEVNAMAEAISQRRKIEREQREKEEAARRKKLEEERIAREKEEAARRKKQEEERIAREKEEAERQRQAEIRLLTEKLATLKEQETTNMRHAECRNKVIICATSFRKAKNEFMEQPVIAFTIQNKSEQTLSAIIVDAVLTSTGRKVPWVTDAFRYSFRGGLNPGEEQKLELSPNMFSDWGRLENRPDYLLELTLKQAEDETGKTIWETYENVSEERDACEAKLNELQNAR